MRNTAIYHLPGLFEFYELYRRFLPLFRTHREYFYDWCEIGSLYGAPENCLWGGGRFSCGECDPQAMMALLREYGISARLTFSNSLLREEHLADERCNALCRLLAESGGPQNGVIVHSDLLAGYLKEHYPQLYLVSSTTKVLTEFEAFRQETAREDFAYVVPDFRLNKAFAQLETLARAEKDKVEFLCNECCWTGCRDRKRCYEVVSRQLCRARRGAGVPLFQSHAEPGVHRGGGYQGNLSAHGLFQFQDRGAGPGQRAGAGIFALLSGQAGAPAGSPGRNLSRQHAGLVLTACVQG